MFAGDRPRKVRMFALSGNVVSPAALPPLDALPPGVPGPVQPFSPSLVPAKTGDAGRILPAVRLKRRSFKKDLYITASASSTAPSPVFQRWHASCRKGLQEIAATPLLPAALSSAVRQPIALRFLRPLRMEGKAVGGRRSSPPGAPGGVPGTLSRGQETRKRLTGVRQVRYSLRRKVLRRRGLGLPTPGMV